MIFVTKRSRQSVNLVELELCLSEAELVDVALTRAQRAKAGQMLTDEDVTEREPR
jgi:hypothetical protein